MPTTLRIHEATVQTMQVEIQVLKVGKKQVTMGMFRQLPAAPLLSGEELSLRGVPWGHVNYWWDGDGSRNNDDARLHIIWQQDTGLYRSVIHRRPSPQTRRRFQSLLDDVMKDLFLWLAGGAAVRVVSYVDGQLTVEWQGLRWCVSAVHPDIHTAHQMVRLTNEAAQRLGQGATTAADDWWMQRYGEVQEKYLKLLEHRGLHIVTDADLLAQRAAVEERRVTYEQRWEQQWQTLQALPQLYIAI
jgi:hypothetical protein